MKNTFTPLRIIVLVAAMSLPAGVNAQCTAAELNWDNIDFLPSNNTRYTSFFPSATFPYNQNFTIGTRTVNFAMAPASNLTLNGENGTNTGHTGSLPAASPGDDVQFTTAAATNSTITMTFDLNVTTVQFSIFDLDNNQSVNITATNAGGAPVNISAMTLATATSGINITGSGTASATATGPGAGYADTDNRGTLNVRVDGPVARIVITLSNAGGNIWLSDIGACVTGTFPLNYQQISRPFTGQPQYVITVVNNNIYYVDPTNGQGYFLFNEPGHNRLNSLAYDPYERVVYYTYSLTGGNNPVTDKVLKKYDVDTKTISVVIPDVNTFGIPTYESGVESGSATFYNGSLYLGIEGYTGTDNSGTPYAAGRKSTIWKINFDAAGNPVAPAAQVWGVTADDGIGAQNIHDWSDFGISNGVLTDFDGSQSGQIDYYSTNLMTGVRTRYAPVGPTPRQVSIGWNELLYNVDVSIGRYNGTNGIVAGTTFNIFAPLGPTIPVGSGASWGDAAGPYRPFLDFGDAPATYDPDPWSPACHDTLTPTVAARRTKLILGPDEDLEWLKKGFTTIEDTYEDGLAFVPIFSPVSNNYLAQVSVLNNTGANATVCAWLDFNGNGTFDAIEGINPVTVVSAPGTQTIPLVWPSTPSTLLSGTFTYLRIRITSGAMTRSNSTGYYSTGEVEDYRVIVDNSPLSVQMMSFDTEVQENKSVKLSWQANEEINLPGYDVERSVNGSEWDRIAFVPSSQAGGMHQYEIVDKNPYTGTSLYRVKMGEINGYARYSNIRAAVITKLPGTLTLYPNPVIDKAIITITGGTAGQNTYIQILDAAGNPMSQQKITLTPGINTVEVPVKPSWQSGVYFVRVTTGDKVEFQKFVLQRR
ncbi:MAG: GEVED domain-containing protein [Chitinophagaceae bacterium]